jgi:hypothetical protein
MFDVFQKSDFGNCGGDTFLCDRNGCWGAPSAGFNRSYLCRHASASLKKSKQEQDRNTHHLEVPIPVVVQPRLSIVILARETPVVDKLLNWWGGLLLVGF